MDTQTLIQTSAYVAAGFAMGAGAIGAAVGEGHTAAEANLAISRNPELSGDIFKNMLVGQAVAESASIFALVVAMILLFMDFSKFNSILNASAFLAAGFSMGFGAVGSGIGSGFPAGAACQGIMRQPSMAGKLTTNMLIGSAVCQTPSIFALVTSFILIYTNYSQHPVSPTWAALLGAGLATGLGAIGSGIGGGTVAMESCRGIARQPRSAGQVLNIMLLGQAVTQTPAILGLLVSFILIFKSSPPTDSLAVSVALLSAGVCMGFGAIGPGIGEGVASSAGVKWVARNTENANIIVRTMLVGMAVSESTAIYAMVVSLCLIFMV